MSRNRIYIRAFFSTLIALFKKFGSLSETKIFIFLRYTLKQNFGSINKNYICPNIVFCYNMARKMFD